MIFACISLVGLSVQNMISGTMMYTYVDKDHFNVIKVSSNMSDSGGDVK